MEREDRPRLKVVELGTWLAAPGAAALLGDLSAEITKVESPSGDPGREFLRAMGGDQTSPTFALLNRGKNSIVLDLLTDEGREAMSRLLEQADVFVTNLRAGSLERLGLDPARITARHPRLIYASITGMGLRGPERDSGTFDVGGFWARTGLMHQILVPDSTPPSPTGGFGDMMTALAAYAGIVSALLRREWTGTGGLVETSLLQTGSYVMAGDLAAQAVHGRVAGQRPRVDCRTPLVNSYRSGDGRWFFLTEIDAAGGFPRLAKAIGQSALASDPRYAGARAIRANRRELIAVLDRAFACFPLVHWAERFAAEGVLWERIASPDEVLVDPQLHENGMLQPISDGNAVVAMTTSPFTLDRKRQPTKSAPALLLAAGTGISV